MCNRCCCLPLLLRIDWMHDYQGMVVLAANQVW